MYNSYFLQKTQKFIFFANYLTTFMVFSHPHTYNLTKNQYSFVKLLYSFHKPFTSYLMSIYSYCN